MLLAIANDWGCPVSDDIQTVLRQWIYDSENKDDMKRMNYWMKWYKDHATEFVAKGETNFRVVEVKFVERGEGE